MTEAMAHSPLLPKDDGAANRSLLARWFYKQGKVCAKYPKLTALVAFIFSAWTCVGLIYVTIETSPEKIWVPPHSDTQQQQSYFNFMFDPFYRIEEIYFTTPSQEANMVTKPYLLAMLDLQEAIATTKDSRGHTLDDLCFKPIKGQGCIIESPLNYWRSNRTDIEASTLEQLQLATACSASVSHGKVPCLSQIGVPVMRDVVLGGITCNETARNPDPCGGCIPEAKALVLTLLLNDTPEIADDAAVWEKEVFIPLTEAAKAKLGNTTYSGAPEPIDVSFMAQRSIQDELSREDSRNAFVVAVSYVAMFVYISVALGKFPHPVKSRSLLGLLGILIVICSVGSALGMCSFFGTKITMIVTEVVPFLILAIGVDNMFIIAKAFDRHEKLAPNESIEELMGRAMAEVGPSITAAATSEFLAFGVGATTKIPALESFCLVAAVAVMVDFVLQVTWFVAGVAMDARRIREHRADMLVCRRVKAGTATTGKFWTIVTEGAYVRKFFDKFYSKHLMHPASKVIVILLWIGALAASCYGATQLKLGLPQQLVLPSDSYLVPYFDQQASLGEAGPPVYIVLQNVDYTANETSAQLNLLNNGVAHLSEYIDPPVYTWFAAFETFYNARVYINTVLCLSDYCDCPKIPEPSEMSFPNRVQQFLNITIDSTCCQHAGYCGAQFAQDVRFVTDEHGELQILSSRMRTVHTALRDQADFIEAMMHTQATVEVLGRNIPQLEHTVDYPGAPNPAPGGPAFAYSLFYVYYEQYSYIQGVAIQNVLAAVCAVFFATLVISNLATATLVSVCVISIVIDLVGWLWLLNPKSGSVLEGDYGVNINAVSVVNLVMAVGLAVEFCVHVAKAFGKQTGTRNERAQAALSEMGSSVVTGITLTKFCGVLVLAWAPSHLFRLYYFRMYLGIIVLGAFHGLMFAPVVLSLVGPGSSTPRRSLTEKSAVDLNIKAASGEASGAGGGHGSHGTFGPTHGPDGVTG